MSLWALPAGKPKADRTNKKAEVIALMKRAKGATLPEIMKATDWQAHTDSQGNIWVTNRLGNSARGAAVVEELIKILKSGSYSDELLVRTMSKQVGGPDGGSVTLLRPDDTRYTGSPFTGGNLPVPKGRSRRWRR